MLLVSRFLRAGDGGSAAAVRAWLDRAAGLHANPTVATMFWHGDCVCPGRAPSPLGAVVTGQGCGCVPLTYHGRIGSVISDANIRRAGALFARLVKRANG